MLDVVQLFKKYRISFRDSGKNVSRNNIVISCPLCNKSSDPDRGEHLVIRPATGQSYCFRNPRHSGSLFKILRALEIPKKEYEKIEFKESETEYTKDDKDYSEFHYFSPAEESNEALRYLESRLFSNPLAIAQQFDLRVSKQGRWVGRLIIPLTLGWTGRAMRGQELRYDAYTSEEGFFLHKHGSYSVVIAEGALDCMRVASVSKHFDVIGKCRMTISAAIISYLQDANYSTIYLAPDESVDYLTKREDLKRVKAHCPFATVTTIHMLDGRKDFCETPESDVRRMITSLGSYNEMPSLR